MLGWQTILDVVGDDEDIRRALVAALGEADIRPEALDLPVRARRRALVAVSEALRQVEQSAAILSLRRRVELEIAATPAPRPKAPRRPKPRPLIPERPEGPPTEQPKGGR